MQLPQVAPHGPSLRVDSDRLPEQSDALVNVTLGNNEAEQAQCVGVIGANARQNVPVNHFGLAELHATKGKKEGKMALKKKRHEKIRQGVVPRERKGKGDEA
jgi:hypothetical protein